jgi:hypothetical protein
MGFIFVHIQLIWEQNSDHCTDNWLEELNIWKRNYVHTGINLTIFQFLKMLNFSQFLRLWMSEFDSVSRLPPLRFTNLLCTGNSYNVNLRNAGFLHVWDKYVSVLFWSILSAGGFSFFLKHVLSTRLKLMWFDDFALWSSQGWSLVLWIEVWEDDNWSCKNYME